MLTFVTLFAVLINVCYTLTLRTKLLNADQIREVHCCLLAIAFILCRLKIVKYKEYFVTGLWQILYQRGHTT
jgi:hypothetical protein